MGPGSTNDSPELPARTYDPISVLITLPGQRDQSSPEQPDGKEPADDDREAGGDDDIEDEPAGGGEA
jgi:hypothetical protein